MAEAYGFLDTTVAGLGGYVEYLIVTSVVKARYKTGGSV